MTNPLWPGIWAELLKARRSLLPPVSAAPFAVGAGVGGMFMFILQDRQRARSLGLLGAKAELSGSEPDWPGYLDLLAQITAVGGLLIFGLILIWSFGREFSDHTAADLLALPTGRTSIVAAKLTVTTVWCLLLSLLAYALGLAIGTGLRLPGWSTGTALHALGRLLATAAMTVLLAWTFGLVASIARGYLAAVGAMFLAVFLAQIMAALGYGRYFPWSIPSLFSGVAGRQETPVGALGVGLVVLVGATGAAGTALWWRNADHTR
jgi:ABC-2 type transport system permease protein